METFYFIGITLGGGLLALFLSAGWGSFQYKKIPEKAILFRWFVAGIVAAGLLAYAWIFGSGGDVGDVIHKIGGALDLENVMNFNTVAEVIQDELTIGMPNF